MRRIRPRALPAVYCFFFLWRNSHQWVRVSSFTRFLDHTKRRTAVGSTPLDEGSARRRDLYLTTHNTHNRQTSLPSLGFEHTISAGERSQTHALDRAATGTGAVSFTISYSLLTNLTLSRCSCQLRPKINQK
jgi:hypothetical protein